MIGCKPVDTPIDPNRKLCDSQSEERVDTGQYQRLVGKLIYLAHTRPDIAFAINLVSQFMHSPTKEHLEAAYRILRYLKGSPGRGLYFKKGDHQGLEIYTDANWVGSITDRRSTSDNCSYVWGNLVTWRSKKQNVVARRSAESEFRAMASGICELLWLRKIMIELRLPFETLMKLYCDNKAAIVTPQTRGSIDNPLTRGIYVPIECLNAIGGVSLYPRLKYKCKWPRRAHTSKLTKIYPTLLQ